MNIFDVSVHVYTLRNTVYVHVYYYYYYIRLFIEIDTIKYISC